jgi:hypothetical protein
VEAVSDEERLFWSKFYRDFPELEGGGSSAGIPAGISPEEGVGVPADSQPESYRAGYATGFIDGYNLRINRYELEER